MRLLIRCQQCNRTYDATGHPIGNVFRCLCGVVVEIREPRGHEARVVRCSSCGGACEQGSQVCLYCSGDFTLHDRDLNTVCPRCLARVSDRAKFCHHCGVSMAVDLQVGAATERSCPVCGDKNMLSHRQLEGATAVLECERCAGMWVSKAVFKGLTERAKERSVPQLGPVAPPGATLVPASKQLGPAYRPCPYCDKFMARQNYGRVSGVIIDVCTEHGVWFDAHELDAILRWLAEGGAENSRARGNETLQRERAAMRTSARRTDAFVASSLSRDMPTSINLADVLGSVMRIIFSKP